MPILSANMYQRVVQPYFSLGPFLIKLLLGLLLKSSDVVHRHPMVTIYPAKHLEWVNVQKPM